MPTDEMANELFREYITNVRPLLAKVVAQIEMLPIGILNEIRAVYDHTARIRIDILDTQAKERELESARRHFSRIMLDCYKTLCIQGEKLIEAFQKDYRRIRLGEVDNGTFLPEFTRLKIRAKQLTEQARVMEGYGESNRADTLNMFQEATTAYDDIQQFIDEKSQELAFSASHQRRHFWSTHVIALIIGIFTTCLGGWILKMILK